MSTFLEAFLPHFKRQLAYGKFYKCLPFQYEGKRKQIILVPTVSRKVAIRIWILIHGFYLAFEIANLSLGRHSLADKLVGSLILAIYCCCFWARLETEPDATPMENLNRLLSGVDEEKKHIQT